MTYKQIKWMILIIPSLIIGVWEFVRHQFLMPYLSMSTGNLITPLLLFLVSVTLLYQLFVQLEMIQEELQLERAHKAELEAREQMARELHDGIAQSLFLLSVKIDKAERKQMQSGMATDMDELRKTVHEVNRYVRQSISNLKYPVRANVMESYDSSLKKRVEQLIEEIQVGAEINWDVSDHQFTSKEKIELLACIREALVNAKKHANATHIRICGQVIGNQWGVTITDNGTSHEILHTPAQDKYGLRIMRERTQEMGWEFQVGREDGHTLVHIEKREES